MNPPRLIFVNRVYWPEEAATAQLLHDLAVSLARAGVNVRVIASATAAAAAPACPEGVDIRRLRPLIPRGRGLLSRAGNYASFWLGALIAVMREARRGDIVVAMTDPPLLGIAVALAARLRGARLWHWCQDVYPELAMVISGRGLTRGALALLRPLRDWAWRSAEGCTVLGNDMAALLAARGVRRDRIHVSPNWAPAGLHAVDATAQRRAWGIGDAFVVGYSGNLGRVHSLMPLIDVAERLKEREDIVFLLIGDGAQRTALESEARRRTVRNVRFLPAQPRAELSLSLSAADLHVVTLRPGCEGTVWPSKFYGALSVERPVLYIGPPAAEVAALVDRHGLGGSFAPDNVSAIAAFIAHCADHPQWVQGMRDQVRLFSLTLPGLAGATAHWTTLVSPATAGATRD